MPTVRAIPPEGVPGIPLRATRATAGRTVYVGDTITDASADPQTVQDWTAQVKAQGLVATRFPTGLLKGQLATRRQTPDPVLGWDYQLAPITVRMADNWRSATDSLNIAAGEVAAELQSASLAVLQAPANALSWALDIPKPVLVIGGALLLYVVAVALLPHVRGWRSVD